MTSGASVQKKRRLYIVLWVLIPVIVVSCYVLFLTASPARVFSHIIKTSIDLNTDDDAQDNRNRIQISKIDLEVPFYEGGAAVLDQGAWHRYPERGNPKDGGNFILSAHRFQIGVTSVATKRQSPFYNLEKLEVNDSLRIFYKGQWYDYKVNKKYQVKPNEVAIEAPSSQAKLTLYSCTLKGSADGRIVIEAQLQTNKS